MKKTKRKVKPWAIVLDFDDTCSSFLGPVCDMHNSLWGGTIHPSSITSWDWDEINVKDSMGNRVLGAELYETFKKYESCIYSQMPPLPDTKKTLDLMAACGYKIIIVTARAEEHRLTTEYNIAAYGLPVDELHFSNNKVDTIRELCKTYKIAAFADDKASTVESVFDSDKCKIQYTYLVDAAHNSEAELDDDIIRISSIFEIVRKLKNRAIK